MLLALVLAGLATLVVPEPAASRPHASTPAAAAQGGRPPPGFRVIVVNRDSRVNPLNRAVLSVLCPRAYAGISWGFQVANFLPTGTVTAVLESARPIVRANGVPAGWSFTVFHPGPRDRVSVAVRLQATCIRPLDGSRIVGRGGAGRAQRSLAATGGARRPTLALGVVDRRGSGPGLAGLCPRGERAFAAGFTIVGEGEHRLAEYEPRLAPRRSGFAIGFAQPAPSVGRRPQGPAFALVLHLICAHGLSGLKLHAKEAPAKPKPRQLLIGVGSGTITVGSEPAGGTVACTAPTAVALGVGVAQQAPEIGRVPAGPLGASHTVPVWGHPRADSSDGFDASRRVFVVVPGILQSIPVVLDVTSLCLKAALTRLLRTATGMPAVDLLFPHGQRRGLGPRTR